MLKAQSNLAEALKAYEESLTIREALIKTDTTSADLKRDLQISVREDR